MSEASATAVPSSAAEGIAVAWRLAQDSPFSWKRWRNLHDQFVHLVAVELRLLLNRSMIGMALVIGYRFFESRRFRFIEDIE